MDEKKRDEPKDEERARAKEAERNRRELDDIPPPGTDPLHEGP